MYDQQTQHARFPSAAVVMELAGRAPVKVVPGVTPARDIFPVTVTEGFPVTVKEGTPVTVKYGFRVTVQEGLPVKQGLLVTVKEEFPATVKEGLAEPVTYASLWPEYVNAELLGHCLSNECCYPGLL